MDTTTARDVRTLRGSAVSVARGVWLPSDTDCPSYVLGTLQARTDSSVCVVVVATRDIEGADTAVRHALGPNAVRPDIPVVPRSDTRFVLRPRADRVPAAGTVMEPAGTVMEPAEPVVAPAGTAQDGEVAVSESAETVTGAVDAEAVPVAGGPEQVVPVQPVAAIASASPARSTPRKARKDTALEDMGAF